MSVVLNIPGNTVEEIVNTQIKLAVTEALRKDTEGLIAKVVAVALDKKDRYDRDTVLDVAVKQMIVDAAKNALTEWIEENKPKVQKALLAKLKSVDGLVAKVADRLIDGLSNNLYVSVSVGKD